MKSKRILCDLLGFVFCALLAGLTLVEKPTGREQDSQSEMQHHVQISRPSNLITVFMCGDVMIGRGIDQVLPHPSNPLLHESYVQSARRYVELAERANGPIPKPVDFSYPWEDALEELERMNPDLRMINLETSVTTSNEYWRGKGIHYRMHPKNIPCLTAAKIDFCSLANNHVLDWGYDGLMETLEILKKVKINSAGAGQNLQEAKKPAVMEVEGKGRVVVFSYGLQSSGIPPAWAASKDRPGVNLLRSLSDPAVRQIKEQVDTVKQKTDIVIASIHWGGNWGYNVNRQQREFAHKLIDHAHVDVIHGHSSHHVKGIEVYKERLIIYGSGDFLNDYEGISGYENFRDDLALMYFVSMDPLTGKLVRLHMTPMQIRHFRANKVSRIDALWLRDVMNREGKKFGTRVRMNQDSTIELNKIS